MEDGLYQVRNLDLFRRTMRVCSSSRCKKGVLEKARGPYYPGLVVEGWSTIEANILPEVTLSLGICLFRAEQLISSAMLGIVTSVRRHISTREEIWIKLLIYEKQSRNTKVLLLIDGW